MPEISPKTLRTLAIGAGAAGAPMSFADLIAKVSPAVVSIAVRQKAEAPDVSALQGIPPEDLPPGLEQFFRRGVPQEPQGLLGRPA